MKASLLVLVAVLTALGLNSCRPFFRTEIGVPGAGYTRDEAYNRGYADGSADRLAGRSHNPHINEDSTTLPSAHRKNYIWGYTEGYRSPSGAVLSTK
ncbi:hypothetical protein [Haloferula sargassicola]|uniref:Membrane lipoprotein n=1 Tax=Haloferula sargassicola TaxID=490096 RepID=A0ABP9UTS0_9BACT